ncbi:MAG: lactate/malate dehydrogenase family protein [Pirellula sp.]|nr:lactate/malate dehydrogenase family protein [Pirellula sp.]
MKTKIAVVGVGHVGSTIAFSLLMRELADEIVLINRTESIAIGEAADLNHAAAFASRKTTIIAGGVEAAYGAQVILFTMSAPLSRSAKSRNEIAIQNRRIIDQWLPPLVRIAPDAIVVMVSNPVDAMTYVAWKCTGLPATQVLGTGTLLDSARYRSILSEHLRVHPEDIRAYVLGEHGESQFPALSIAATGGEKMDKGAADPILFQQAITTADSVFRVKGYTNYAIALASTMITESIVRDSHRTLPVSTLIEGFCDVHDVCLSVPCIVGRQGIVRQLQPALNASEIKAFQKSAAAVTRVIQECMFDEV